MELGNSRTGKGAESFLGAGGAIIGRILNILPSKRFAVSDHALVEGKAACSFLFGLLAQVILVFAF